MTPRFLAVTAALLASAAHCAGDERPRAGDGGPVVTDPYLWLEVVESTRSLDWVRARNAESLRR